MNYQFIQNIHDDGTAEIFLFGEIGGARGISGQAFANEIQFLNEHENTKEIIVHINSAGGLVNEGLSIFHAIKNSRVPVTTYNVGIAASIAGILFQAGHTRKMNDFARLMIHSPKLPTNEAGRTMSAGEKEAIKQISDLLSTILSNNSRITEQQARSVMERETWLDAKMSLSMGFVDEIVSTDRQVSLSEGLELQEIEKGFVNSSHEYLLKIQNQYNDILTKTNKVMSFKNLTNHLNLAEEASEKAVLTAVKAIENNLEESNLKVEELETSNTDLSTENETLKTENETLKAKVAEFEGEKITNFVETAIADGKYKSEDKESLIEKATNDFESFQSLTNSIVVGGHVDITKEIQNNAGNGAGDEVSLRELEKNSPAKVADLIENNTDEYIRLYEKQYGVKPSIN